jgi:hypothetical protein
MTDMPPEISEAQVETFPHTSFRHAQLSLPLSSGESSLPDNVATTVEMLLTHGIDFRLSRNRKVGSCREAAKARRRGTAVGIPLWDELKSYLGKAVGGAGRSETLVALHCRADCSFDMSKVRLLLDGRDFEPLSREELGRGSLSYGTINPFVLLDPEFCRRLSGRSAAALQLFDAGTLAPLRPCQTMMTNAGDLTWAVEFSPREFLSGRPSAVVDDLVAEQRRRPPWAHAPTTIAIVTADGVDAACDVQGVLRNFVDGGLSPEYRRLAYPHLIVHTLPQLQDDHRPDAALSLVRDALHAVCKQAPSTIVLTFPLCPEETEAAAETCDRAGVQVIRLEDCLASWVASHQLDQVAIFSSRPCAADSVIGSIRATSPHCRVEWLEDDAHEPIFELLRNAHEHARQGSALQKLGQLLARRESEHVVVVDDVASIMLRRLRRKGRPQHGVVDHLQILGDQIAARRLELDLSDCL